MLIKIIRIHLARRRAARLNKDKIFSAIARSLARGLALARESGDLVVKNSGAYLDERVAQRRPRRRRDINSMYDFGLVVMRAEATSLSYRRVEERRKRGEETRRMRKERWKERD